MSQQKTEKVLEQLETLGSPQEGVAPQNPPAISQSLPNRTKLEQFFNFAARTYIGPGVPGLELTANGLRSLGNGEFGKGAVFVGVGALSARLPARLPAQTAQETVIPLVENMMANGTLTFKLEWGQIFLAALRDGFDKLVRGEAPRNDFGLCLQLLKQQSSHSPIIKETFATLVETLKTFQKGL